MNVLTEIQVFWWNLFALVTSPDFEEVLFQVYLSMGQTMIAKSQLQDRTSAETIKDIAEQFRGFSTSAQPTTGLSMVRMWPIFRPTTIATFDRVQELLRLGEMAATFDRLVWKVNAPIIDLSSVRLSIAKVLHLARTQVATVKPLIKARCKICNRYLKGY